MKPSFLLPYGKSDEIIDYRPSINAAGTSIVFERQIVENGVYSKTINLFVSDLAAPSPKRLLTQKGSTRPDWCWYADRPVEDGPITFSNDDGVYVVKPIAGSEPHRVLNSTNWIYPTWFPGCKQIAVDATQAISYAGGPTATSTAANVGPETIGIDLVTGFYAGSLSGRSLWAGFPSVNRRAPNVIAFAGQQFSTSGYNQDLNYVYIADSSVKPPRPHPLDPQASIYSFDPQYEGRAPTWSPDGRWIAFESNRTCGGKPDTYAIYVEDGMGRKPAVQITACRDNVQHAKWYRYPVDGRVRLIASALLYPGYAGTNSLLQSARGIAWFDVTDALH